ncbi:MAG TPA: hypothetical protein ENK98_01975 [Epsilonproteobacteria bacterium]|nr:hypothetical protein [Campylobacterota bacterium]
MKKIIPLVLLFVVHSYADFKSDVADRYARGLHAILFFTSEDIISSGHYTFDALNGSLDSYFFPFSYSFKSDCDDYNYYLNGSIGFSNYKEDDVKLNRGTTDSLTLHTYALKIGGGTRFNTSSNTDIKLGAAYIYSRVDGSYKSSQPLNLNDANDKAINAIFNSIQNHHTFEVSTSFGYHPVINDFKPYARIGIRHFTTKVDESFASIKNIQSSISQLKVGLFTPPVTSLFGMPLRLEPYASSLFLSGDLDNALNLNRFYVLGTTFRFGSYPLTCWVEDVASLKRDSLDWVKELTFDINLVKGDNFDGFNVGLGVKF